MKKIIWTIIDKLNLDAYAITYQRKNKFLNRLIPPTTYYSFNTEKNIKVNDVEFTIKPRDMVQHKLLKPNIRFPEVYGIDLFMKKLEDLKYDEPLTVFDIGSNCGQFSLLFTSLFLSKYPGKKIQVHCFEANPYTYKYLERNFAKNPSLSLSITKNNIGIGEEKGKLTIQMPKRNSGAGSLVRDYQNEENVTAEVNIQSLDEYFDNNQKLKQVNFMKIDVEDFEPFVLRGAQNIIEKFSPDLYMESGQDYESQMFIYRYLWHHSYTIYAESKTKELTQITEKNVEDWANKHDFFNIYATH
jgi:FkbM family methyltransferase